MLDFKTILTPERQAHCFAVGMVSILTLGTFAAIAACFAALWAVVELATLLLQSIIECLTTIGTTYQAADPLVRFLMLVSLGYVLYRAGRLRFLRRDNR